MRDHCLHFQDPGFHIIPYSMVIPGKFWVSEHYENIPRLFVRLSYTCHLIWIIIIYLYFVLNRSPRAVWGNSSQTPGYCQLAEGEDFLSQRDITICFHLICKDNTIRIKWAYGWRKSKLFSCHFCGKVFALVCLEMLKSLAFKSSRPPF